MSYSARIAVNESNNDNCAFCVDVSTGRREDTIQAIDNIILREIAGEFVLIPVGEAAQKIHGMVTLTQSGAFLWERLQKPCQEDELVRALLGEYEIDRQTAEDDVTDFLNKLQQRGLLYD